LPSSTHTFLSGRLVSHIQHGVVIN
jgi:hypothetical protein